MKKIQSRNRGALARSIQIVLSSSALRHIHVDELLPGGGGFKLKTAVILLIGDGAEYVVAVRQNRLGLDPLEVKLLRRTNDNIVHAFTCLGLDTIAHQERAGKPKPIKPINELIDQLCGDQLELFQSDDDHAEFEKLKRLACKRGTPEAPLQYESGVVELSQLDKARDANAPIVDVFYKSENTTLNQQSFKILMFTVVSGNRNDVYAASFHRAIADQAFRTLMAHYKYGRHGKFMSFVTAVARSSKSGVTLNKVESELHQRNSVAICLTQPRDQDGNVDQSFTALNAYVVTSAETIIDGTKFFNIINNDGEEVPRRVQHFIAVPRSKRSKGK
jgi:hypothetical protein